MFLLETFGLRFTPFFMDGQLAVYIFFVLSGYVLSIGFLETGNQTILSSLALRRYPRLTIPIIASCLLALILINTGAIHNIPAGIAAQSPWLKSFYNFPASFFSMIKLSLIDVYFEATLVSYNAVLWTMHYELIGSFLVLGGLYFMRGVRLRIAGYIASLTLTFYFQSPLAAFAFGVMLADLSRATIFTSYRKSGAHYFFASALLLTILYVVMMRNGHIATPFGLSLASCLIIGLIGAIPKLKKALGSKLSLWLGHISFPLYLTHLLVICSASSWIYLYFTEVGFDLIITSALTALLTFVTAIFVAILFTPVESFAIRISRSFSNLIISRGAGPIAT